ncbi:hypothetical protein ACHAPU_009141 [Fusarium lateritium]
MTEHETMLPPTPTSIFSKRNDQDCLAKLTHASHLLDIAVADHCAAVAAAAKLEGKLEAYNASRDTHIAYIRELHENLCVKKEEIETNVATVDSSTTERPSTNRDMIAHICDGDPYEELRKANVHCQNAAMNNVFAVVKASSELDAATKHEKITADALAEAKARVKFVDKALDTWMRGDKSYAYAEARELQCLINASMNSNGKRRIEDGWDKVEQDKDWDAISVMCEKRQKSK